MTASVSFILEFLTINIKNIVQNLASISFLPCEIKIREIFLPARFFILRINLKYLSTQF